MATTGVRRSIVYLFDNSQPVDEQAVPNNALVKALYNNPANYLAPALKWEYIQFDQIVNDVATPQTALLYEFYLTPTGDANFNTANLMLLAQQLNVASVPTFSEQIVWGT